MYKKNTRKNDYARIKSCFRVFLLSFARSGERSFGGIAAGKAASEGTTIHFFALFLIVVRSL